MEYETAQDIIDQVRFNESLRSTNSQASNHIRLYESAVKNDEHKTARFLRVHLREAHHKLMYLLKVGHKKNYDNNNNMISAIKRISRIEVLLGQ